MGTLPEEMAKMLGIPYVPPKEEGTLDILERHQGYKDQIRENKVRRGIREKEGFFKKEKNGEVIYKIERGMNMNKNMERKLCRHLAQRISENSVKVRDFSGITFKGVEFDKDDDTYKRIFIRNILKKIKESTDLIECSGKTAGKIWFLKPKVRLVDLLKDIDVKMFGIMEEEKEIPLEIPKPQEVHPEELKSDPPPLIESVSGRTIADAIYEILKKGITINIKMND